MANKKKCQFGKLIIEYINHVILENGVVVDLKKSESIQHCLVPKLVKGVHGFFTSLLRKIGKLSNLLVISTI